MVVIICTFSNPNTIAKIFLGDNELGEPTITSRWNTGFVKSAYKHVHFFFAINF